MAGTGTPIVHVRVASLLAELAPNDVEIIPVGIHGHPDQFCILNATRLVRCIDDKASGEVQYWRPEDGRPEKTGQYRAVYGMRIDPSTVSALERSGATGAKFKEV